MMQPRYFGHPQRTLLGMLHGGEGPAEASTPRGLVIAPPLLQEGIGSQRAMWSLAELVAASGASVLRFDWFGTGNSGGGGDQLSVDGLRDDMQSAVDWMQARGGAVALRQLGLRSACLPLLAAASRAKQPVDVVLWDPVLDGQQLVQGWHLMHRQQMSGAGRYPFKVPEPDLQDLLGFDMTDTFLREMGGMSAHAFALPVGSRLLVVAWDQDPAVDDLVARQVAAGVQARVLLLDTGDRPDWDDPGQFETQVFPRRAVAQLAQHLAVTPAWA